MNTRSLTVKELKDALQNMDDNEEVCIEFNKDNELLYGYVKEVDAKSCAILCEHEQINLKDILKYL